VVAQRGRARNCGNAASPASRSRPGWIHSPRVHRPYHRARRGPSAHCARFFVISASYSPAYPPSRPEKKVEWNFPGPTSVMVQPEYHIGFHLRSFVSEGGQKDVAPSNVVSSTGRDCCCVIRAAVCGANCSCDRRCRYRWSGRRPHRRFGRGGHRRAYRETRSALPWSPLLVARQLLLPCAQRQMVSRFPPILPLSRGGRNQYPCRVAILPLPDRASCARAVCLGADDPVALCVGGYALAFVAPGLPAGTTAWGSQGPAQHSHQRPVANLLRMARRITRSEC
jgi:hypothetical protein